MEYLYSYFFLNVKRCQKACIACVNLVALVIAFFSKRNQEIGNEHIKIIINYKKIELKNY